MRFLNGWLSAAWNPRCNCCAKSLRFVSFVIAAAVVAGLVVMRCRAERPTAPGDDDGAFACSLDVRGCAVPFPRFTRFPRFTVFAQGSRSVARTVSFPMSRTRSPRARACSRIELDGRNGALVDALQPDGRAQHHEILIERLDTSRQTDAVDEIDFDALALFARGVHEVVLRMRFCGVRHCKDGSESCFGWLVTRRAIRGWPEF
jgi:hypothetical protein